MSSSMCVSAWMAPNALLTPRSDTTASSVAFGAAARSITGIPASPRLRTVAAPASGEPMRSPDASAPRLHRDARALALVLVLRGADLARLVEAVVDHGLLDVVLRHRDRRVQRRRVAVHLRIALGRLTLGERDCYLGSGVCLGLERVVGGHV